MDDDDDSPELDEDSSPELDEDGPTESDDLVLDYSLEHDEFVDSIDRQYAEKGWGYPW